MMLPAAEPRIVLRVIERIFMSELLERLVIVIRKLSADVLPAVLTSSATILAAGLRP